MDSLIKWFTENWVGVIAVYLAVHKFLVSVRDVLDKTPATDDNWFEKAVTVMGLINSSCSYTIVLMPFLSTVPIMASFNSFNISCTPDTTVR